MVQSRAYYNEIDPFKAEVLREAIKAGAIAPGDVDERSIADVQPGELVGYTQCHFFAGGGFWSLALRQAGWPDDRPVWTGSCPCPGFSVAGKGGGFADPRHLWPEWSRLIRECRPGVVFGEQADGAIGHGWLDLVSGDMEAEGYAFAAAVLGAHSAGAPHIRQRLYFCADTEHAERRTKQQEYGDPHGRNGFGRLCNSGSVTHATDARRQAPGKHGSGQSLFPARPEQRGDTLGTADTEHDGRRAGSAAVGYRDTADSASGAGSSDDPLGAGLEGHFGDVREWRGPGWLDPLTARSVAEAGATRGFWADCDWWYGRDGKYRPIGPGLFPLAHGSAARVGRLRMYGDAIVVPAAQAFIESVMEIL